MGPCITKVRPLPGRRWIKGLPAPPDPAFTFLRPSLPTSALPRITAEKASGVGGGKRHEALHPHAIALARNTSASAAVETPFILKEARSAKRDLCFPAGTGDRGTRREGAPITSV
jgi:hypothetical protein